MQGLAYAGTQMNGYLDGRPERGKDTWAYRAAHEAPAGSTGTGVADGWF